MVTKTVTTNDLMGAMHDMMQMTNDGFERLENRMDRMERRADGFDHDLQIVKAKLLEHDLQFVDLRRLAQELTDKHSAYINDIADILDRVAALEKRASEVTKEELYELQVMLQKLVDWVTKVAEKVKVPIKLP